MDERTLSAGEALSEMLDALNKSMVDLTGKDLKELTRVVTYFRYYRIPETHPPVGRDVLLQYETKAGESRRTIARWTGELWSGHPFKPVAWMPLPDPYEDVKP